MKHKQFGRKLNLNKETIARIGQQNILGGATALCSAPCPCLTPQTAVPTVIEYTCAPTCEHETDECTVGCSAKATKCDLTQCVVCPCISPDTTPPTLIC